MNLSKVNSSDKVAEDFTQTWRYKAGISLFVIGNIGVGIGVLMPMLGLVSGGNAGLVGVLIVGGELVALTSIVFLGKAGFLALKNKMFGVVKAGYAAPVGAVRHYIGIALFLANALALYFIVYYAWASFGAASPEMPMTEIWGLDLAQQWELVLGVFLAGEISFLISLYVLGADWWERFRNIFVWQNPNETTNTGV